MGAVLEYKKFQTLYNRAWKISTIIEKFSIFTSRNGNEMKLSTGY